MDLKTLERLNWYQLIDQLNLVNNELRLLREEGSEVNSFAIEIFNHKRDTILRLRDKFQMGFDGRTEGLRKEEARWQRKRKSI